jgi:hypothetical protein
MGATHRRSGQDIRLNARRDGLDWQTAVRSSAARCAIRPGGSKRVCNQETLSRSLEDPRDVLINRKLHVVQEA